MMIRYRKENNSVKYDNASSDEEVIRKLKQGRQWSKVSSFILFCLGFHLYVVIYEGLSKYIRYSSGMAPMHVTYVTQLPWESFSVLPLE